MIRNKLKLNKFYQEIVAKEKFSYKQALVIYESLYREARALGAINSRDILSGLETDLRVAKIINKLD